MARKVIHEFDARGGLGEGRTACGRTLWRRWATTVLENVTCQDCKAWRAQIERDSRAVTSEGS